MARPKGSILNSKAKTNTVPDSAPVVSMGYSQETEFDKHAKDNKIHVDQNLRDSINYARKDIETHTNNENVHVTEIEKVTWNSKESVQGAQAKANKVLETLNNHTNNNTVHITKAEKDLFKDKYTKAETRNLVKHTLTGLKFLRAVKTRTELAIKYPDPELNSCVKIKDSGIQMIFNGTEWVDFNGILTPEVTLENDGLMSSDDKTKLDTIEENANYYIHPDNTDIRHVSDAEKGYWSSKADNVLVTIMNDGLMSSDDKTKLDTIEENANYYIHPETHDPSIILQDENNRFVTDTQIKVWDNKVEKDYVDTVSNDILSTAKSFMNSKIASIFNTTSDQLEVFRKLAFEFKQDTVVDKFFNLFNSCTKNEEFNEHVMNDKIHMSRNDASLLQNVKDLLSKGMNSDWNEQDTTSIKYIENKPEKLPADGGNADTVGNYTAGEIINETIETFDTTILKSDSNIITESEVELLNNKSGSIIVFRPDTYPIERELVLRVSNKTFRGLGNTSKLIGASIRIIGNNNTIENLCFANGKDSIVKGPAIVIEGDNNTIRNTSIINYDKGIVLEGSNNTICHNNLSNIRKEAIEILSDINSNYGNIVIKNRIRNSNIGIILNSSKNILSKNHITKNNILDCGIGIILSNKINDNAKTTMNIISENIVMRGNGKISDYLPNNKTIISEFSSKNIINCNIVSGKDISAPYDVLSNNIS